jgi:hypothetical protein
MTSPATQRLTGKETQARFWFPATAYFCNVHSAAVTDAIACAAMPTYNAYWVNCSGVSHSFRRLMPRNSAFVKPESQYQFRIARAGRMAFEINCLNRSLLNILQDLRHPADEPRENRHNSSISPKEFLLVKNAL